MVYLPSYEYAEKDEVQSIAELEKVFVAMAKTIAETEGSAHRAVHAKGQALLKGRLDILTELPDQLAHGIFEKAGSYQALVRFSSPPTEQLPDGVATPRAVALKVIGVPGERVAESLGDTTQDFLMVNGPAFVRPGSASFLKDSKLLALKSGPKTSAPTLPLPG